MKAHSCVSVLLDQIKLKDWMLALQT